MNTDKGKAVTLSSMAQYYFLVVHLGHAGKRRTIFIWRSLRRHRLESLSWLFICISSSSTFVHFLSSSLFLLVCMWSLGLTMSLRQSLRELSFTFPVCLCVVWCKWRSRVPWPCYSVPESQGALFFCFCFYVACCVNIDIGDLGWERRRNFLDSSSRFPKMST